MQQSSRATGSVWQWTRDHLGGIALTLTVACQITICLCFLFGGFMDPGPYDWFTRPVSFFAGVTLQCATILAIVAVFRKRRNIPGWIAIGLNLGSMLLLVGWFPLSLLLRGHR